MTSRRDALRLLVTLTVVPRGIAEAQRAGIIDTSNFAVMDQSAALPVRLPPKPGTPPMLNTDGVNALERRLRCQCGCSLDLYTCRTTDLVCQVAPAMHRDVMALAQGGHSADEILDAFRDVYGDVVLLAPPASGFPLTAYAMPAIAMAAGIVVLTIALRRHRASRDA